MKPNILKLVGVLWLMLIWLAGGSLLAQENYGRLPGA